MVLPIGVRVECYCGYRGEETPQAVHLKDRRVVVAEVIDRWLAPNHRYFKFRGDDGSLYIIRHDVVTYEWQVIFFEDQDMKNAAAASSHSGKA